MSEENNYKDCQYDSVKETKTCGECQIFDSWHDYCIIAGDVDKNSTACDSFRDKNPVITVFKKIIASPEILAEHFVYAVHYGGLYFWHSTLIYPAFPFETKEEAIAATVAKLKEVA